MDQFIHFNLAHGAALVTALLGRRLTEQIHLFTNMKICSQLKPQGLKDRKKPGTESTTHVRRSDFCSDLVEVAPLQSVLGYTEYLDLFALAG